VRGVCQAGGATQSGSGSRHPGANRAVGNAEDHSGVGIRHAIDGDKDERVSLLARKPSKRSRHTSEDHLVELVIDVG
jgi:hypothetical protein